jgi:hypothetical protein
MCSVGGLHSCGVQHGADRGGHCKLCRHGHLQRNNVCGNSVQYLSRHPVIMPSSSIPSFPRHGLLHPASRASHSVHPFPLPFSPPSSWTCHFIWASGCILLSYSFIFHRPSAWPSTSMLHNSLPLDYTPYFSAHFGRRNVRIA